MMSLRVAVDQASLANVLAQLPDSPRREEVLGRILDRARYVIQENVMQNMPDRTGNMRRQTDSMWDGSLHAEINMNAGYTKFVDGGAVPHAIFPRNAQVLRFVPTGLASAGNVRLTGKARKGKEDLYIYRRAVNHPGQAAQEFVRQGFDDSLPDIEQLVADGALELISV